jgi:hypothetical protein
MRKRHVIAAAALTVAALPMVPAQAAKPRPKPKPPACNLLTDAPNDAGLQNNPNGLTYDPSLDVISADVATNAKDISWVIRVAKLRKDDPQRHPGGMRYEFTVTVGTASVSLFVTTRPTGEIIWPETATKTAWDETKNEIRVTQPIAKLPTSFKNGAVLRNFQVLTFSVVGLDPSIFRSGNVKLWQADNAVADAKSSYVAGSPSCVKIGF